MALPALRPVPQAPPRAVVYTRQSTHREESVSLELQETAGRDYCARHGYGVAQAAVIAAAACRCMSGFRRP